MTKFIGLHASNTDILRGKVVVVKDPNIKPDDYFSEDVILVTPIITPQLTLYIKKIKAAIIDYGSIGSHAMTICREYKIPYIIGTIDATHLLKTGDTVDINFKKKTVETLMKDGTIQKIRR